MSTKLKEILTKNGPDPTPLNPISSQAKADPGLAPAMFLLLLSCFCFFVSNHKSTTSRQPRRVKLDLQPYFNPTKRNLKKKNGVT